MGREQEGKKQPEPETPLSNKKLCNNEREGEENNKGRLYPGAIETVKQGRQRKGERQII